MERGSFSPPPRVTLPFRTSANPADRIGLLQLLFKHGVLCGLERAEALVKQTHVVQRIAEKSDHKRTRLDFLGRGIRLAIAFHCLKSRPKLLDQAPEHVLDKAYQLSHSLIAFGRGELFGVGLGGSVEKLYYLPEAHTDFIMAVVAEETGFVGVCLILFIYYWLIRHAFEIGRVSIKLERFFQGLLAQGIGVWFGVQVFINVRHYKKGRTALRLISKSF